MPATNSSCRLEDTTLAERHLRELRDESAISLEVIAERNYRTETDPRELVRLGFAEWQALPGLLIPLYGPDGSNGRYALKPDRPRVRDGKKVKYEAQAGRPSCLDVPRRCLDRITDPSVDLFITETSGKKVDALATIGKCALGIQGVWNWQKDHALIPDWEPILPSLPGRRCFVVFDSDAVTNPNVRLAEDDLAIRFLEHRGADAYIIRLPPGPNGEKQGADDFIARDGAAAFNSLVAETVQARRARTRELEQLLSAQAAFLRNKDWKPVQKLVTLAIINEAGWRESTGAPTPYTVNYGRLAAAVGVKSTDTVANVLNQVSGEQGLFTKHVTRDQTVEGEWRSVVRLEPHQTGGVVALLKAAPSITLEAKAPVRRRAQPWCPDHPVDEHVSRRTDACTACGQVVYERERTLKPKISVSDTEVIPVVPEETSSPPPPYVRIEAKFSVSEPPAPAEILGGPRRSTWQACRTCAEQMVGGPRCYTHNPTPEMRAGAA